MVRGGDLAGLGGAAVSDRRGRPSVFPGPTSSPLKEARLNTRCESGREERRHGQPAPWRANGRERQGDLQHGDLRLAVEDVVVADDLAGQPFLLPDEAATETCCSSSSAWGRKGRHDRAGRG